MGDGLPGHLLPSYLQYLLVLSYLDAAVSQLAYGGKIKQKKFFLAVQKTLSS